MHLCRHRELFTHTFCLSSHNETTFTKGSTNGQIENGFILQEHFFWQSISLKVMTKGYFCAGKAYFLEVLF